MVANEWGGYDQMLQGRDTQVLMTPALAPRAGRP